MTRGKTPERNAVARARMRVQDYRDYHDQVAEENGKDRLGPIYPAADERRSEHVSRDAGRHRNPERGEAADTPCAARCRDRCEVFIVERAVLDLDRDIDIRRERL